MSSLQDQDLLRSLAQQVPEGEPDYRQMIMTGKARGRRRRLVRHVLQSVAGAGVAAAVGVTAVAVTSFPASTPGIEIAPAGTPTARAEQSRDQQEKEAKKRAQDAGKRAEEAAESERSRVERSDAEERARIAAASRDPDSTTPPRPGER